MKKLLLIATAFCLIWTASAQMTVSNSLNGAIQAALDKSAVLKNQNLELQKMEEERKAVKSMYMPSVSAEAAYVYTGNNLVLDIPTVVLPLTGAHLFEGSSKLKNKANVFTAGLTAKQVIFSGGQIMNGAKALDAKSEGDAYMMSLKKDEVIKDVIHSFDQLRLLDEAQKLLQESEVRLQKETQRVEKAIENGLAIPYDRDKIKLAQLNLDSKKSELDGKRRLLYNKIAVLTNYDAEAIQSVMYELEPVLVESDLTVQNRNELKALDAYSKALDYKLKKEKGSLMPTLGAFASVGYAGLFNTDTKFNLPVSGNEAHLKMNKAILSPNWMVGAAMKWDIFNGTHRKKNVSAVKIDQEILSNRKEDAEEMMQLQLANNLTTHNILLNRLGISEQKQKIAQNNLYTADKQYKLGLIGVTERLQAETDVYEASMEKVEILIAQRQAALEVYSASQALENWIEVK